MSTTDIIAIGAAVVAIAAIIVSVLTAKRGRERAGLDFVDEALQQINRLHFDHPRYAHRSFIDGLMNRARDDEARLKYFFFAALVWNVLEAAYDRRLHENQGFDAVFQYFGNLHRAYFEQSLVDHPSGRPFVRFVRTRVFQEG